ncbi:hypothetical protein [Schumannella sp. 10F1B-5-1]|uniref:hypothetical protein n=1 Tax=Schumannella sp. 10F1B-5-1 TaxID=2590780 RepID=UPI0015E8342F|nr:hypothetical protein [Schumannella sp. 10F1B-5-1]
MTSITVQQTGFGIVVAEDGDADAAALLDGLPPLRAARYLTATPALRQALRGAEPELVDAVRPHLDGTVVVPEDGLAGEGDGDTASGSTRLAQALGVSVIAPAGRFIRGDGTLFSVGGGDGWVTQSPRGARVPAGRRYPAPAWQAQLPHDLKGAAHIPAGLWITSGTAARHAVRLAGIAVRERQLLVVVGSPSETPPTVERLLAVLRSLPDAARSSVVLAGFGAESLPLETVRRLAEELGRPLRVAHGVEIDGRPVRIDGEAEELPATFALESVCAPDGAVTLERWAPPPGLVSDGGGASFGLGTTRKSRGRLGDTWVVDVVAAGLVVRPASEPRADTAELRAPAGALGIFVQGDGAGRAEALPALLAPLRERLEQGGSVSIHPLDAAGRRLVRDAYPGQWAPTEALAITADGRLVAATADASGDTDLPLEERPQEIAELEAAELDAAADEAEGTEAQGAIAEAVDATLESGAADDLFDQIDPLDDRDSLDDTIEIDVDAADTIEVRPRATTEPRSPRDAHRAVAPRTATVTAVATVPAPAPDATATVDPVVGGETLAPTGRRGIGAAGRRAREAIVAAVTSAPDSGSADRAAGSAPVPPVPPVPPRAPAPSPWAATPAASATSSEPDLPAPRPAAAHVGTTTATTATTATAAAAAEAPSTPGRSASDALTRALQGSAATRLIGTAPRDAGTGTPDRAAAASTPAASTPAEVAPPAPATATAGAVDTRSPEPVSAATRTTPSASGTSTAASAASTPAAPERPAPTTAEQLPADESPEAATAREQAPEPARPSRRASTVDVPIGASSTSDQRHRVRTTLGSRYDVASRTVSQLLAQQPGMRVAAGDRSAMLTGLSLVRVFATEPHGDYDLDFHTCLAEGLAMLPTARSVVVRGVPAGIDATPGSTLRLRTPLVAAAANGPATGPAEALIWTTSGRRLDRVLHGSAGAADVVLPAGTRLRVLGTADGSASRLLLAEEGADAELALARLQAAAEARGDLGAHADDRWFGDLPSAA